MNQNLLKARVLIGKAKELTEKTCNNFDSETSERRITNIAICDLADARRNIDIVLRRLNK